MSTPDFNAATHPSQINIREGITHLMIAPEAGTEPHLVARWLGLRSAIEKAGGHVQAIAGEFNYHYARDLCVLIGDTAYHPTVPMAEDSLDDLDYRRRAFLPFISHFGYRLRGLNVLPDYAMDGGNFVPLENRKVLIAGQHSIIDEADDINMDAMRAQRVISVMSSMTLCSVSATTWHVDGVSGQLPDGALLVKLDELDREQDLQAHGIERAYLPLVGAKKSGLRALDRHVGRPNLLTFSLFDHEDADVICQPESLRGNNINARAFGLATNFIVVNGIMIGEDLPEPLENALKARGINKIGPKDVGVDTFLFGDEGFVGGARCLTLPVAKQTRRPAYF
ncbi:MAG: hypothetical protein EBQ96_03620 [Proteobacteria bacterium]|nr:hypothetical protein [Pseudomonadota bacterium]